MHGRVEALESISNDLPVEIIDDAVPVALLDALEAEVHARGFQYGWYANKDKGFPHWNRSYAATGRDKLNRDEISGELCAPVRALWDHLAQTHAQGSQVIRAYANAYTFGTEGYIHTDSTIASDVTLLFYLNREWQRDWAGETLFFRGSEVVATVLPKFNRLVAFSSVIPHVARSVSRSCPVARVIFTFKVKTETDDRALLRHALEDVGAFKTAHSGRPLAEHLLNTYDLLTQAGCSRDVCLAGGLHSIYGTSAFRHVSTTDRSPIIERFGAEAERLVHLFSTIDRPRVLEDDLAASIDAPTLHGLRLIEAANLIEQGESLAAFPHIAKVWRDQCR